MLISCPKCHSIYEIPDDLIGKTGQNFRCQACSNVWHAMRSDALGYEEKQEEEPFIEAIEVSKPPERPWPSERKEFIIPADSKSGRRTPSSTEVIKEEGDPNFVAPAITPAPKIEAPETFVSAPILNAAQKQHELTLTSDKGTSFTISTMPLMEEDEDTHHREPHLFSDSEREVGLSISKEDRMEIAKPFKGYKKSYALLILLFILAGCMFLRREIVTIYPKAETYYNKIGMSGLYNESYLKFSKIDIKRAKDNNKDVLKVVAEIKNDSFYTTYVPPIKVSNVKEEFVAERSKLKGYESTKAEFTIPLPEDNAPLSLNLTFTKP